VNEAYFLHVVSGLQILLNVRLSPFEIPTATIYEKIISIDQKIENAILPQKESIRLFTLYATPILNLHEEHPLYKKLYMSPFLLSLCKNIQKNYPDVVSKDSYLKGLVELVLSLNPEYSFFYDKEERRIRLRFSDYEGVTRKMSRLAE